MFITLCSFALTVAINNAFVCDIPTNINKFVNVNRSVSISLTNYGYKSVSNKIINIW